MGRIGITYQEVEKSISELQGQQKNPTVDNIRGVLGTGSKSTIARFLREWKKQHGLRSNEDGSIPSELLDTVKGLWHRLQLVTNEQVTKYQKEFDEMESEIRRKLNRSTQEQAALQTKIHQLEELIQASNAENKQLLRNLGCKEKEKIRLTEQVSSLNLRRKEMLAENKRLHDTMTHVQKNLEHYQSESQRLRQEQSILLEKQQNEYSHNLLEQQKRVELLAIEKSTYQAKYEQFKKENTLLEKKCLNFSQENKKIESLYEELKLKQAELQKNNHRLSKQHQEKHDDSEHKRATIIELEIKLTAREDRIISLTKELSAANDKIQSLRHDQQFVSQEKAYLEGQLKQLQTSIPLDPAVREARFTAETL